MKDQAPKLKKKIPVITIVVYSLAGLAVVGIAVMIIRSGKKK